MKKIILMFAFVAVCTIAFGQSLNEKRAQYFTDQAATEFSLSKDQVKELYKTRLAYHDSLKQLSMQVKSGDISAEDNASKSQEINRNFKEYMVKFTGKTQNDLNSFYDKIKEGLKAVK